MQTRFLSKIHSSVYVCALFFSIGGPTCYFFLSKLPLYMWTRSAIQFYHLHIVCAVPTLSLPRPHSDHGAKACEGRARGNSRFEPGADKLWGVWGQRPWGSPPAVRWLWCWVRSLFQYSISISGVLTSAFHLFCPFLHICPAVLAVISTVTSQHSKKVIGSSHGPHRGPNAGEAIIHRWMLMNRWILCVLLWAGACCGRVLFHLSSPSSLNNRGGWIQ